MTGTFTKTLRIKVKPNSWTWLDRAAREVNQAWNWANETSARAARPFAGPPKWLSKFDLDKLSAGASKCFEHIGADTIQRINAEYATRRRQFKRHKLHWRVSLGSRRSLGWVPFKAASLRRTKKLNIVRFCGKSIRLFEDLPAQWRDGQFAQDALGQWWLCLPIEVAADDAPAPREAVGIDLGLEDLAVTSDSERLDAGTFYRDLEAKIQQAQRRGHKRQAKRLHRRAVNLRNEALHQFSRKLIDQYQTIIVGDVSSTKLVKTRFAKAVLDSGWGKLKTQLQYKGQWAGRGVKIVNEANTTRVCSSCGSATGPSGLRQLVVRQWRCSECGAEHDRDVNAARNILAAGLRHGPPCAGTWQAEAACLEHAAAA